MKTSYILSILLAIAVSASTKAQDSARVAATLKQLLSTCRNVDFGDSNTQKLGAFYKAAPYIVYQGDDEKRRWKDIANYNNADEKEQVDQVCLKINNSVNQDSAYKVVKYVTNTESEGKWHVVYVNYIKNGRERHAAFAFLKVKGRFALGDID
jgi:hypothetical protein